MFVKNIKYTDFKGVEREEPFYFNIKKSEAIEMELEVEGGYSEYIKTILEKKDRKELAKAIKNLILTAYGVMSNDGKHFVKNTEETEKFFYSRAYDQLYIEFVTDPTGENFLEFVQKVFPDLGILPNETK